MAAIATAAAIVGAGTASAAVNLVTNGSFETNGGNGELGFNTTAAGWSVGNPMTFSSYVFLYNASATDKSGTSADLPGTNGVAGPNVSIWGPDDGSNNGLTVSPDGGAFITSDPAYRNGPISQMISGLTPGGVYTLMFDWAGSQQAGMDGVTTEGWQASLGSGPAQSTPLVTVSDKGFSGWMTSSFTFTADATSDLLSFLATGGPGASEPPFSLLDGVSLTAVSTPTPEPASWSLMLVGVGALGAALRARRRAALAA